MRKSILSLTVVAVAALVSPISSAIADHQIDKVVFTGGQTPALPGRPSVSTTGVRISGTIDFPTSYINVWAHTGSSWILLTGSNVSVSYSAQDTSLYGRTTYRFFVNANANGSFPIKYLDFDAWNGARWVKMSETKGLTVVTGTEITKKQF